MPVPMMRPYEFLNKVKTLKKSDKVVEFAIGGVDGLAFRGSKKLSSWVLRYQDPKTGKRKTIGLGTFKEYPSLAAARSRGLEVLYGFRNGVDIRKPPKVEEEKKAPLLLVAELVEQCLHEMELNHHYKDTREYLRVFSRIRKYALPLIGKKSPEDVTVSHIAEIYRGAQSKDGNTATSDKTRDALQVFFNWCVSKGYFPADRRLPTEKRLLAPLVPKSTKGKQHMKAFHYTEMPRLFAALVKPQSFLLVGSLAVAFAILTGIRPHMLYGKATSQGDKPLLWGDIAKDFSRFTVNAEALKIASNGDAVIPLSTQAQAILLRVITLGISNPNDPLAPVFVGRAGNAISEATMNKRLRQLDAEDVNQGGPGFRDMVNSSKIVTMHGTIRASLETWALEERITTKDVAEMCLLHAVDRYKGAYNRAARVEERREVLQQWADFCFSECPSNWNILP